ncbi:hypothetical protein PCANC_28549 [Puccinia coronata f. sp. avenae]|uniref:Uncharacterized protein n=1 Tax=Puccinia coronata f. sp. avenae TaxID=200324 RepID=A0A2N5RZP8_9BASI|nr:hypothetical protein PCANC_28549 [Puccinia coronata f. sp. avenae]
MSTGRTPNHPVLIATFLEAHGDPAVDCVRGSQYGFVLTQTTIQCAGLSNDAALDLPVTLLTNMTLSNTILTGFFFFLTGRFLAPNDGTSPVVNYAQEALLPIPLTLGVAVDSANKTFIVGLGQVVERQEAVSDNTTQTTQEIQIVGNLVDWDTKLDMAVVMVTLVSLTLGQTLTQGPVASGSGTSPGDQPRCNLIKLTPRKDKLVESKAKGAPTHKPKGLPARSKPSQPSPPDLKGKHKMQSSDTTGKESNPSSSNKSEASHAAPIPVKQANKAPLGSRPRSRPRNSVIQDAAKRMKMM